MDSKVLTVAGTVFLSRHELSPPELFFRRQCSSTTASNSGASRRFYSSKKNGDGIRFVRRFSTSALVANSTPSKSRVYTVGDFMTRKESLRVVKPSTTIDEALEILVDNKISGFPVIDDDWKLLGVVSDYDLLALDSISGSGLQLADGNLFPEVDSNWKVFNELQRLLGKTNGRLVADVMTPAPVVVRENTNLDDSARLLLETRYRRLPVVDASGKLVGILTRGNVISAALEIKRAAEN